MKVLFLGGNGNISWYCVQKSIEAGFDVWVLNRGVSYKSRRAIQPEVNKITGDISDIKEIEILLQDHYFDVVCDFICYNEEQAMNAVKLFEQKTKQYIFISSTANYQKVSSNLPYVESTFLYNPVWEYTKNKILCEKFFLESYQNNSFPVTIVRPGHTYDTIIPEAVGNGDWTNAKRMMEGKPVIIHGDGSTLWTVTHSEDFANAFIKLFNNQNALGEAFHITSDKWLTWREITCYVANALGVKNPRIVYIPSEIIAQRNPFLGQSLIAHKAWCDIYDNSKIKSIAQNWQASKGFEEGIAQTIEWLRADYNRQRINKELSIFFDTLIKDFNNYNLNE